MTPLPPRRDLPDLQTRRRHLMSEIRTPARRPRRHLLVGGLLTGAVVAVALVVAPGGRPDIRPSVPGQSSPLRLIAASEVLTRASEKARTEPEPDPRSGRYLYFESKVEQDSYMRVHHGEGDEKGSVQRNKMSSYSEVWYPIGGRRAGLLRGRGENFQGPWPGNYTPKKQSHAGWFCKRHQDISEAERRNLKVEPDCEVGADRYRDDLPTEADGMYKWLYDNAQGGNPANVQAFHTVGETLYETYLPPASRAALFAAAARIPGTTVREDVTDLVGRKGVAVGITWNDTRFELIFDAVTYTYFGERMIVDHDNTTPVPRSRKSPSMTRSSDPELDRYQHPGHVIRQYVLLRVAQVDRADERP